MARPPTFLCVAFYFKGLDFIKACKEEGNHVLLLTKSKHRDKPWPWESIEDVFYMEEAENTPGNLDDLVRGLADLLRRQPIDRIVALDDFDVEKAALLREEFRFPGMGQSTARCFRDKLAMRMEAMRANLRVPPFSPLFNDEAIGRYLSESSGPWVIKPRSEASAAGIRKVHSQEEAWQVLETLGNQRFHYLIEQFKPGDVFHTDSLIYNRDLLFCQVSQYMDTPFEVAHGGGIFRSTTVEPGSPDDKALRLFTAQVARSFGMDNSTSHTEFIRSREDGQYYFLETSARVGGAHLAEMVEAATGINLWREWARLESALVRQAGYQLPSPRHDHAGILISLTQQVHPDDKIFSDPEIAWRLQKDYHIGMIVRSENRERVLELLDRYAGIVGREFHTSLPPQDHPTD